MQKMNERKGTVMRWYPGGGRHFYDRYGRWSVLMEDGTEIDVLPSVYAKRFAAYLESIGMQRTSWSEIMHKAEDEWQKCRSCGSNWTSWSEAMHKAQKEWERYCRAMDTFAENYQQWLDDPGPGVFIERPAMKKLKRGI